MKENIVKYKVFVIGQHQKELYEFVDLPENLFKKYGEIEQVGYCLSAEILRNGEVVIYIDNGEESTEFDIVSIISPENEKELNKEIFLAIENFRLNDAKKELEEK